MINRLNSDPEDLQRAKGLFRWSILYMFGVCLLLVISRLPLSVQFDNQFALLINEIVSLFANVENFVF